MISFVKDKISLLFQNSFLRNVAVLISGTAGAQAITMLFSPVITRVYGPEAFGLLGAFLSAVAIANPVAALTYPIAIVLPKEDSDAKLLGFLSTIMAVIVAIILSLVLALKGRYILSLIQAEAIVQYIQLIPVMMLFTAFLQIAEQYSIRLKLFHVNAKATIIQSIVTGIVKVGGGILNPAAVLLIGITTAGKALHAVLMFLGIRKNRKTEKTVFEMPDINRMIQLAGTYRDFPLFRAPQYSINALSQNLPLLMLAAFFGPSSAGFFAICARVLAMPVQLIGKSVADVIYPRFSEAVNKKESITHMLLKSTAMLAAVGLIPFGIVFASGPWLFGFVFGQEWTTAGEYARWLSLWFLLGLMIRPSIAAIPVLKMQGWFLVYEIISVIARVVVLWAGYRLFENEVWVIILFSITGVIVSTALISITIIRSMYMYQQSNA